MKVKTIKKFRDIKTGELHKVDSAFDVTAERYAEIQKAGAFVVPVPAEKVAKKETETEAEVKENKAK